MLKFIKLNGACSIQDLGRLNAQHLGFSASGAADEYAFLFANSLLNNAPNSAALEITLGQVTLQSYCDCFIAITGADCRATLNDDPIEPWQVHPLSAGDILHLSMPKKGLHSYLAVAGGIDSKRCFGSQAQTYGEQSLGVYAPPLVTDSEILLTPHCVNYFPHNTHNISLQPKNFYALSPLKLRFIPQRQWWSMSEEQQQGFIAHNFTILSNSNRMGYRLSAIPKKSRATTPPKLLSKAVTFGTIQLPPNNEPIILMKERQTSGGYLVLGCVFQTDLFRLSQMRPGEKVSFIPASLLQAQQQLSAFYQRFFR